LSDADENPLCFGFAPFRFNPIGFDPSSPRFQSGLQGILAEVTVNAGDHNSNAEYQQIEIRIGPRRFFVR
jgi:hypothetical protein